MVTPDIILEFKYTQLLVRKLHNSSKRHPLLGVCNITICHGFEFTLVCNWALSGGHK